MSRVAGEDVHCVVEVGGLLSDKKGINIPGAKLSAPALSEKDRRDAAFSVARLKVDYLALSIVRQAGDVLEARALARGIPVIAKIEKPEAVENLDSILDVADGVMVARGDLGVELGAEKVPLVQKRIIREANRRGKLAITATQMLDSMIRNPRPTRAEAADVANAVLDGADALMLSGETATGAYPPDALHMMRAIIGDVETDSLEVPGRADTHIPELAAPWDFSEAAAKAAALLSYTLPLKAIVTLTRDGRTARLLSIYRPNAPIVAITVQAEAASRLALRWGVVPRSGARAENLEDSLRIATYVLTQQRICGAGDAFALVVGWLSSSSTNTIKLHRL